MPSGSVNAEAMETAEDAALLATSSSEGDEGAVVDDDDNGDLASARQDAVRAAGHVSTLRLAPPEPSGISQEPSAAGASRQSNLARPKRKEGAQNGTARLKASKTVDHGRGISSNNTRTDASTRKKPKRTSDNNT